MKEYDIAMNASERDFHPPSNLSRIWESNFLPLPLPSIPNNTGCFNFPCEVKRSPKIRSLYLIEMTYYIFGMFCLFLWEVRIFLWKF